ncbi:MAG TPA: ABC transporter ATP-binding protein [Puia sp.]|nr:ABC transporter ATP-binding protein [Puia sp.]
MSNTIIRAENISKYYRLGTLGARSFKEDMKRIWKADRSSHFPVDHDGSADHIWALKHIDFEVNEGEVLGFIGRNGAGKSTLLKIISRITLPTSGLIRGRGRIASLLEVGTGFHGELTGRENIYLNGHILGMKKKEIDEKFDEIVDFSGVSRFIDTPVKRYSSGMYVRLAFAVAAHLDPEILIVDEVLAVGDAEFQNKCIGKMKEVSYRQGRTILFVSHNMEAQRNLCQRVIALNKGTIVDIGKPETVIAGYLKNESTQYLQQAFNNAEEAPGNNTVRIRRVQLVPEYPDNSGVIDVRTALQIHFECWYYPTEDHELMVSLQFFTAAGDCVFETASEKKSFTRGLVSGECRIPGHFLNNGSYYISISFMKNFATRLFYYEACLSFDVEDYRENGDWYGRWNGQVRPAFPVILRSQETP